MLNPRPVAEARSAPADSRLRVMIVDDSVVIRGLLSKALEADPAIRVVASVGNGEMALGALAKADAEVAVLDIEMPVMDGLTALPKLVAAKPGLKVIMASTLTLQNAAISLKALKLGAMDYVPKPSTKSLVGAEGFNRELVAKVKAWGAVFRKERRLPMPAGPEADQAGADPLWKPIRSGAPVRLRPAPRTRPDVLAIGSSTGGPQALGKFVAGMGAWAKLPVFVTQHMPPTFTTILAEHLGQAAGMPSAEGKDGEEVEAGRIYVAPGDFHMTVAAEGIKKIVRLLKTPPENFCRPSVDPMLRGLVSAYGGGVLVVMLTGMGSDGLRGSEAVVAAGGQVIAQDEATSVVWGMPGAVTAAGLCTAVLPLLELPARARNILQGGVR
jgi:two-component system chemotaxis response regulator CheB